VSPKFIGPGVIECDCVKRYGGVADHTCRKCGGEGIRHLMPQEEQQLSDQQDMQQYNAAHCSQK